jgi:putative copper export protein
VAPLLVAVRGGADLALLLGAGLLLFVAWGGVPTPRSRTTARALVVAAPLFAATYAWIWAGEITGAGATATAGAASALAGPSDVATRLDALTAFASGRALALESALAMLTAWALFLARRPRLASIFALAAVASGGLSGHPASYTPLASIPASALHQLAVAAWAGGLLYLVTEAGSARFTASIQRVSRVALTAVVVVAITGLAQTWLLLGSPDRLLTTPYGVLVLGKIAGLAGLVACGVYHRYRLIPRLLRDAGRSTNPAAVAPSVALELALAAAEVLLAAVLSHIPPNP